MRAGEPSIRLRRTLRWSGRSNDVRVCVMGRKEKSAGTGEATRVDREAAPASGMMIEGDEAVDLYARQIAFNLNELEKQVELLRTACVRTGKLLREVE